MFDIFYEICLKLKCIVICIYVRNRLRGLWMWFFVSVIYKIKVYLIYFVILMIFN